jgi:hypothetical protein
LAEFRGNLSVASLGRRFFLVIGAISQFYRVQRAEYKIKGLKGTATPAIIERKT